MDGLSRVFSKVAIVTEILHVFNAGLGNVAHKKLCTCHVLNVLSFKFFSAQLS